MNPAHCPRCGQSRRRRDARRSLGRDWAQFEQTCQDAVQRIAASKELAAFAQLMVATVGTLTAVRWPRMCPCGRFASLPVCQCGRRESGI